MRPCCRHRRILLGKPVRLPPDLAATADDHRPHCATPPARHTAASHRPTTWRRSARSSPASTARTRATFRTALPSTGRGISSRPPVRRRRTARSPVTPTRWRCWQRRTARGDRVASHPDRARRHAALVMGPDAGLPLGNGRAPALPPGASRRSGHGVAPVPRAAAPGTAGRRGFDHRRAQGNKPDWKSARPRQQPSSPETPGVRLFTPL